MNSRRIFSLTLSCLLCVLAFVAVSAVVESPTGAASTTRYVAPDGFCGGHSPCYMTVQAAVDAAQDGDAIHVAAGTYTDVHSRPAPPGYPGPGSVNQVVFVDKTVAIEGGYNAAFTGSPDPQANPTTLNALTQGRLLFLTGEISPTIEGLRMTGGDASGLGGRGPAWDSGGGVYAITATVTLSNNQIFDNVASSGGAGGGIYLYHSSGVFVRNTISSNTATWSCAGLGIEHGIVTLDDNTLSDNSPVEFNGGGLCILYGSGLLRNNLISGNGANGGGGVYLSYSEAECHHNVITGNTAVDSGGGVAVSRSTAALDGDRVMGNIAGGYWGGGGGGVSLFHGEATLSNVVLAENEATVLAPGLYARASQSRLTHVTIARNTGGDGSGLYVAEDGGVFGTAMVTNAIVVSQTVGVMVASGSEASLEATLWGSGPWANGEDWAGAGTVVIGAVNVWGLPGFVDPDAGEYHITLASAAVDEGIDAGVERDLDGERRPMRFGYDIGADEYPAAPAASFVDSGPDWLGELTTFTNTTASSLTITCLWEFGDGVTSTLDGPDHFYTSPGSYTAVLTATSAAGTGVATSSVTIYGAPAITFTSSSPNWLGQATTFTPSVTTVPTQDPTVEYVWAFGDGTTSTLAYPVHEYTAPGWYTVAVTATNGAGRDEANQTVVVYGPPHADFLASPLHGVGAVTVTFTNTTATVPRGDATVTYSWAFGDGGMSSLADPEHCYSQAGTYTVTLAAQNAAGSDARVQSGYVTVYAPVHADFSAFPRAGAAPLTVTFLNESSGDYDTSFWAFGDGLTSTVDGPAHIYTAIGTYTVSLTVTGEGGEETETKAAYVTVRRYHTVYLPCVLRGWE